MESRDADSTESLGLLAGLQATADLFSVERELVFFAKDVQGRYIAVNETLAARCGVAGRDELIGKTVHSVYPQELASRYAAQDRAVVHTGRAITERLELHWYPNRRAGWCLTSKTPLRDSQGRICGLVGISRDLSALSAARSIPVSLIATLDALEADVASFQCATDLAKRSGLSPTRFARLIKRIFRVPPSQILAQARVATAMRLLAESPSPVAEVAQACGYYDQSAFTRAFRANTGLTPSEFRRTCES